MNTRHVLMIAALAAASVGLSRAGFGQNLLDQELGGQSGAPAAATGGGAAGASTPAPAAAPAGPANPKPAAAPSEDPADPAAANNTAPPAPGGADIVSPEAVQRVDDDDLVQKLTNSGQPKPAAQPVAQQVQSMLNYMGQSAKRLTQDKDPGDATQEDQRRIILDLDTLIAIAEKEQQQGGGGQSQGPPQQGPPRQFSTAQGGGMGQGGSQAANAHPESSGSPDIAAGELRNHDPATWGKLPPRDREAVADGVKEEYLPAYRDLIDRYYQALAELAKSDGK